MRRGYGIILAMLLPGAALAQQAVIRIEAKRSPAAAETAAQGWQDRFGDVVTFPLPGGWTAIGLGPMDAAAARARLAELKAAGRIPADSFIAVPEPGQVLTPVGGGPAAGTGDLAPPAGVSPARDGAADIPPPPALTPPAAAGQPEPAPTAPLPAETAPGFAIRLQALPDRAAADTALADWRETYPDAGLWQLPNGRFAIALSPVTETAAKAWLASFKQAGLAPKDAFVGPAAELGQVATAGKPPALPEPPSAATPMPPLEQVQRALRWAGHYSGKVDGKDGPATRQAIAAEIAALRVSPDAGTAMAALIARRAEWQQSIGLGRLEDAHTGLSVSAPMDRLQFERTDHSLSIYGPRNGSGAALILFSQPGGQQEMLDLTGLVTALGWVPAPERRIEPGHALLTGGNEAHLGRAEAWVRDGRAEGYVLIWPAAEPADQTRIAAEISDSFARLGPARNDPPGLAPAPAGADGEAVPPAN